MTLNVRADALTIQAVTDDGQVEGTYLLSPIVTAKVRHHLVQHADEHLASTASRNRTEWLRRRALMPVQIIGMCLLSAATGKVVGGSFWVTYALCVNVAVLATLVYVAVGWIRARKAGSPWTRRTVRDYWQGRSITGTLTGWGPSPDLALPITWPYTELAEILTDGGRAGDVEARRALWDAATFTATLSERQHAVHALRGVIGTSNVALTAVAMDLGLDTTEPDERFTLGRDAWEGVNITLDPATHTLIAGQAGVGKTVALQRLARQAVEHGCAVLVFAERATDWEPWQVSLNGPRAVTVISWDTSQPEKALDALAGELTWHVEHQSAVPVAIVIDGLPMITVVGTRDPAPQEDARQRAEGALEHLVTVSQGVTVFAATPQVTAVQVPAEWRTRFDARVLLGPAERHDLLIMFGDDLRLPHGGDAVAAAWWFGTGEGLARTSPTGELVGVDLADDRLPR